MTDETRQNPSYAVSHGNGCVIRAGDIVHHKPTGEDWVVAYVDGNRLAWCGWPDGTANLNDCWLKKSCTDEEHVRILNEIAKSSGRRASMAKRALEQLTNSHRPDGSDA